MAIRMITVDSGKWVKITIIGAPGIGKTSLLRTIPEGAIVVVISAESGLLSVRDLILLARIAGYEVFSFRDFREAFDLIKKMEFPPGADVWIFVDSITEIASRCVEELKVKYPNYSDGLKLWNEYNDRMTAMVKAFRDLEHNVVMTALEAVETDDLNRRYYGPAIGGNQLKQRLPAYFDEVFFMTLMKGQDGRERRVLVTQPYDRYPAKDRSGKLDQFEEPHLGRIRDKILFDNQVDCQEDQNGTN